MTKKDDCLGLTDIKSGNNPHKPPSGFSETPSLKSRLWCAEILMDSLRVEKKRWGCLKHFHKKARDGTVVTAYAIFTRKKVQECGIE